MRLLPVLAISFIACISPVAANPAGETEPPRTEQELNPPPDTTPVTPDTAPWLPVTKGNPVPLDNQGRPIVNPLPNTSAQGGGPFYRPVRGSYAPLAGSYSPQYGSYQPLSGSYRPVNGAYAPQMGAYGHQTGATGPLSGQYGPQVGGYGPQSGQYGPQVGGYGPQPGGYNVALGGYRQTQGAYQQSQGAYRQSQGGYQPLISTYGVPNGLAAQRMNPRPVVGNYIAGLQGQNALRRRR